MDDSFEIKNQRPEEVSTHSLAGQALDSHEGTAFKHSTQHQQFTEKM